MARSDQPMEYKASPAEFKALDEEGRYEGYFAIIGNQDDGNDIIEPGSFTKTIQERRGRVKVFYGHDWSKLIAPSPEVLREDSTGLFAAGRLTLASFWGRETWALMKDNALNEGSIGYEAIKAEYESADGKPLGDIADAWYRADVIRHLKELKLYEISPVPLGMNALTSVRAVKAAMLEAMKAAIPPKETPKAADDTAWDAEAVLKEVEGAKQLRLIHAWVDPDGDPDVKSSYKLPHHLADGKVVLAGVQSAGAALMGSRSGVLIPDADIAGVKRHLKTHYTQFDKTPPWEEEASLDTYLETLQVVTVALKEGRVLSTASKQKVMGAIEAMQSATDALNELLAAAEPAKGYSALLLVQRMRAAELALAQATRN